MKYIKKDAVNHPAHYTKYPFEVIDIIENVTKHYPNDLGFLIGNSLKYILRAPFKGKPLEDLKKSQFYLNRAISTLES
jgi:Protein of unknwon function (DUF3310).